MEWMWTISEEDKVLFVFAIFFLNYTLMCFCFVLIT